MRDIINVGSIKDSDGNKLLELAPSTTPVNNIKVTSADAGNSPTIAAEGSDADVGITFVTQGAGAIDFSGSSVQNFAIDLND